MDKIIKTPKEIHNFLNEYVIGQDEAKKTLAVAVYNHYKRVLSNIFDIECDEKYKDVKIDKSNVLLIGNTGTGKTYLIKNIAKCLGIPCYIADATKLTESGYVGDDVESILVGLLQEANYDVNNAQMGIVIIDEIDKITRKSDNPSITRDVGGEGVQQGLLKIIEGSIVGVPPKGGRKHPEQNLIYIDTSNILFIGCGAFSGIDKIIEKRCNKKVIGFNTDNTNNKTERITNEDLKNYGLIPELIGRFPIITQTQDLTKDDLCRIIKEPKNSILKQYQKLFNLFNKIDLNFTDEAIEYIAENCIKMKTGARGLRSFIENILLEIMYESSDIVDTKISISKIDIDKILEEKKVA